jgi:NADH-quinone oxidoreductase subunit J
VAQVSNTKELGVLMYTQYLYPLEIAAVILLVAMIAAIALTLRKRKDNKAIDASLAVRVRPRDRVRSSRWRPRKPRPPRQRRLPPPRR